MNVVGVHLGWVQAGISCDAVAIIMGFEVGRDVNISLTGTSADILWLL